MKIYPESTRYISVATGEIFETEEQVQTAIRQYHQPELAVAASNTGGKLMDPLKELLKIADQLDEQGAYEESNEVMEIFTSLAQLQKKADDDEDIMVKEGEECEECGCTPCECEMKKAKLQAKKVIATLVDVADSLEAKGAYREAQLADALLQDISTDLPQAFNFSSKPEIVEPTAVETKPLIEEHTDNLQSTEVPSSFEALLQELSLDSEPQTETETTEIEGTPFADLPTQEEKLGPSDVQIENVTEPEPEFDKLTMDQFKELIDGLKYRYSQGRQREKYEKILEHAEKAQEYKQAYKEWLDYAHRLFEDEPIRLDI